MSWKDGFTEALLKFVREDLGKTNAVEVTAFEQKLEAGARYSEYTVDPDRIFVEITYTDDKGRSQTAEWTGEFSELIRDLAD